MQLSLFNTSLTQEVIQLFTEVFSASENESEGRLIGSLVAELVTTTASEDLIGFVARSNDFITGCIFFSRFFVPADDLAFILSPVAISADRQGTGLGQRLINHGLNHLKTLNVNLVFTYGDPRFYSKTGFCQVSENTVKAPFKLRHPEGWLVQSLDGKAISVMTGTTRCVAALSDQKYW